MLYVVSGMNRTVGGMSGWEVFPEKLFFSFLGSIEYID